MCFYQNFIRFFLLRWFTSDFQTCDRLPCMHKAWTPHTLINLKFYIHALIARFMGPTWGPSGADRTQVGSMLAPWTLLSGWLNAKDIELHCCHAAVKYLYIKPSICFTTKPLFTKTSHSYGVQYHFVHLQHKNSCGAVRKSFIVFFPRELLSTASNRYFFLHCSGSLVNSSFIFQECGRHLNCVFIVLFISLRLSDAYMHR